MPFIFSFNEVATGMSMISPNAATTAGNVVYFMDNGAFYQYSGSAKRLPCSVSATESIPKSSIVFTRV